MRDDEAFLRAVIDNPDDDLPRLVYADYLDEHGDPERAELIRIQCELARVPPEDQRRRKRLWDREWELLGAYREQWAGPLAEFADPYGYRRGFVESITLSAAAFLHHADTIWRLAPVRNVTLDDAWEEMDRLAASPHLARLRTLTLDENSLSDGDVHRLADSPHLANLTRLDLRSNRFRVAAVEALAASPHLARLSSLDLGDNEINSAGADALSRSPFLNHLEELSLEMGNVGQAGVEALAFGEGLPALTMLDLSVNPVGSRGVRALLYGASAARWHRLILRYVALTPEQAHDLRQRFGASGVQFD
jgi:uncharacterized protein (TIGR02996 family)